MIAPEIHSLVKRTVDRAKKGEGTIRKLSPTSLQIHVANMKLNIWEPLNGEWVVSAAHNHTQGFTSTVLYGSIIDERYRFRYDTKGEFDLYTMEHLDERRRMVFTKTGTRCEVYAIDKTLLRPGRIYHMPREDFHVAIQPELTMTLLQLWGEDEIQQMSLIPHGTKMETVERYMPTDEVPAMWNKVHEVCEKAGIKL